MTISKGEILEIVNQFPDQIEIEELIYRLYLREKLEAAEADIAAGQTLSAEELRSEAASGDGKVDSTGKGRSARGLRFYCEGFAPCGRRAGRANHPCFGTINRVPGKRACYAGASSPAVKVP
jgi:hypothetical protein